MNKQINTVTRMSLSKYIDHVMLSTVEQTLSRMLVEKVKVRWYFVAIAAENWKIHCHKIQRCQFSTVSTGTPAATSIHKQHKHISPLCCLSRSSPFIFYEPFDVGGLLSTLNLF